MGEEAKGDVNETLKLNEKPKSSVTDSFYGYTEAQYHDGLAMRDIESIHLSVHNGLDIEEVEEVKALIAEYNKQHPESTISVVTY